MTYAIRHATPADAETLSVLACDVFTETFGHLYPPEDLEAFLQDSYTADALREELADPKQQWLIAEGPEGAVAYAQAGPCTLPHDAAKATHGELKRIYVKGSTQGAGLGRDLMDRSLAFMAENFDGPMWIGVWSGNDKAQRLYQRYGFERAGAYQFAVGRVRDHEFILMKH